MIYHRIRGLSEDKGWTITLDAEKLGMTQTGYSKYERGEREIPIDVLIKLSYLYNTSVDYLLGLTKSRERYL